MITHPTHYKLYAKKDEPLCSEEHGRHFSYGGFDCKLHILQYSVRCTQSHAVFYTNQIRVHTFETTPFLMNVSSAWLGKVNRK